MTWIMMHMDFLIDLNQTTKKYYVHENQIRI